MLKAGDLVMINDVEFWHKNVIGLLCEVTGVINGGYLVDHPWPDDMDGCTSWRYREEQLEKIGVL